jgi:hypothetical protein
VITREGAPYALSTRLKSTDISRWAAHSKLPAARPWRRNPTTRGTAIHPADPRGWMRLMAGVIPSLGISGYKEFHL